MNEDVEKSVGKYKQLQGEDRTHRERDLERERDGNGQKLERPDGTRVVWGMYADAKNLAGASKTEGVWGPGRQAGESGRPLLKHRRGRPLEKSRLAETLTPRARANVKSPESTLCKYQAGKCCARGAAGHLGAPSPSAAR